MPMTEDRLYHETTVKYLAALDPAALPSNSDIAQGVYNHTLTAIESVNQIAPKNQKLKPPKHLTFAQIGDILLYLYPIRRISCAGFTADPESDLLGVYQRDGPDKGIYVTSLTAIRQLARQFNRDLTNRDFDELVTYLKDAAKRAARCTERDLIAVNNGIFDYASKTLMPFDENKIFLAKSRVDYNPNARNITIHNPDDNTDWDVEAWIADLTDDPEITELIWQVLGAIIRPHVRWNKSAWLYSQTGNNGKGTLCELMRNLCGESSYASIAIADFAKDFMLEPLTRTTAIIVDENDVGGYIDRAANLKAVITNDVILINRKFKLPVTYQFFGFMVQCLNEFPRIRDRSDSFYRRQLFIPFSKCFTGKERPYIKNDYLHRQEVLEYVLLKVLSSDYYKLSEPAACRQVLDEYKEFNDPVRLFFEEFKYRFKWDLLPFQFLYSLYKAWFVQVSPSGSIQGRNTFINDLCSAIENDPEWACANKRDPVKAMNRMTAPEPLILEYGLKDWMNPTYKGTDQNQICMPAVASMYRGLLRINPPGQAINASNNTAPEEMKGEEDA